MPNLFSGNIRSRRDISRIETEEYNAFVTIYKLSKEEMSRVGNIEQQIKGQILLKKGHVIPSYLPEPSLASNQDWVIDFKSLSERDSRKYDVTITLAVDIENSTPEKRIYRFEETTDNTDDTKWNIERKGRAGKSKHSTECEMWVQEELPRKLQDPILLEYLSNLPRDQRLEEVLLQKRYNLFLDDFEKYYENTLRKNRRFTAAQRKAAAMSFLIERGRQFEIKEAQGQYVTLFTI